MAGYQVSLDWHMDNIERMRMGVKEWQQIGTWKHLCTMREDGKRMAQEDMRKDTHLNHIS